MKRVAIVLAILLAVLLCGCTESPPNSAVDELIKYSWSLKGENDDNNKKSSGRLNFENGKIILNIVKPDKTELKLNEYYEADDEKIIIISENYGNLTFEYKLYGDELELFFNNSSLSFIKIDT